MPKSWSTVPSRERLCSQRELICQWRKTRTRQVWPRDHIKAWIRLDLHISVLISGQISALSKIRLREFTCHRESMSTAIQQTKQLASIGLSTSRPHQLTKAPWCNGPVEAAIHSTPKVTTSKWDSHLLILLLTTARWWAGDTTLPIQTSNTTQERITRTTSYTRGNQSQKLHMTDE